MHIKTVYNWIEQGSLEAFKTPGNHRRIQRKDLLEFIERHNMPVPPGLESARYKVLIAEDNEPEALTIKELLDHYPKFFEVYLARDGYEALVEIGKRDHDLLILDIYMPNFDGFEVCRRIKSMPDKKDMKILAISGAVETDVKERILSYGADAFLKKPMDLADMRKKIFRLLDIVEEMVEAS